MRQCSRAVDSVRVSLGHVWPLAGCCVLLVVLPAQARAQQSEADDASWALFTGHRYREALHRAGSADAYLRALACMRLGMLYSELGEITTPLAGDYLRVLQALGEREDRHTARSAYTPYYLSLVLRKLGRNERAADLLEAFLGDPIVESSMLIGFATCELGACLHAMGREDEADRQFDAAFALAEGDLHIAAYLALLCLRIGARQEQADMLISRVTRSPEEWSGGSPYSALRLSVLLSARNEHEAALSLLDSAYKRPWRPTPETVDTPEPLQRMEFFPAAMFELVAEVYLRAALDVFSRLRDDDFAYDIQFARALTLYMVGDHVDAAAILVTMRADAALPSEMAPSVAVLLGRCYVKQGRAT
ncbi:hypothetical protein HOI71_18985, partial [Candidatus Poribacteria bacterium]|nr:hypothetical protein [Candidatus Poribacteria bacterium]